MIREDLKFSKNLTTLYDKINYYHRYKELSTCFNTEEKCLEKTDKKIVLEIFKKLGYSNVKYITGESFYQLREDLSGYKFYFHTSLKYGLVELIFGKSRTEEERKTEEMIGGVAPEVCKLIEINKSSITEGYIKDPRFRTYEELEEILESAFSLYEDLKSEFINLYE